VVRPARQAQGQGPAVLDGKSRVGTGEEQPQPLVGEVAVRIRGWGGFGPVRLGLHQGEPGGIGVVSPEPVDGPAARRRQQPGAGLRWDALGRPVLQRGLDHLGRDVLGEIEVAEAADEGGEQPAPFLAEHGLHGLHRPHGTGCPLVHRCQSCSKSATGRTSIPPPPRAPGQRAAQSSATSRSGTSMT